MPQRALTFTPEAIGSEKGSVPYATSGNDIWALGIILINLFEYIFLDCHLYAPRHGPNWPSVPPPAGTAHFPWTYAIPEDAAYMDFVDNATSIYRNLPISKALAAFLLDILDPKPATRLTLNDMRRTVKTIDTFFPTDDELALAPQKIRELVVPYIEGGEEVLPERRIPDVSTTWEEGLFRDVLRRNIAELDHRLDKYQPRHGSSSRSSLWSDEMCDSTDEDDNAGHSTCSSSCYRPPRRVVNPDSHPGSDSSEPVLQRESRSPSPESERGPRTPALLPIDSAGDIQVESSQGTKADGEDKNDEWWELDITDALEEMAQAVRAFPTVAIPTGGSST